MSAATVKVCPACWQRATQTKTKRIAQHWDSVGRDICPGSLLPWSTAPQWGLRQWRRAVKANRAPGDSEEWRAAVHAMTEVERGILEDSDMR